MTTHCGMHSHASAVKNGLSIHLYPVSKDMCERMHTYKRLDHFYGKTVDGLVINGTTTANVIVAGKVNSDGKCQGEEYKDQSGSWSNVVVQAAIEITLYESQAAAKVNENKIVLPCGITCPYREKTCIDTIYGYSYWENVDSDTCSAKRYTVIYEGETTKITPKLKRKELSDTTIYTVDKGDKVFAMPIRRPTMICGQTAFETDHPKFYIIKPSESGLFYFTTITQILFEMDPTAYTNTKVVFVERHLSGQLTKLYEHVIMQKCELEQQVLRNLQTLAVTSPSEFAYAKMQAPGYTAVNHGEVIHIIKCKPVDVTVRHTERCFHELPVAYKNKTLFMTPRSHVLQKYGTEIGCNSFLYSAFKLNGNWYKSAKDIHEIPRPQILEPTNEDTWTYVSPKNLFTGGLYIQSDMMKLQEHVVLPTERQALNGIISRGMVGLETDLQGTNLEPFIEEKTIQHWFEKTCGRAWNWFTNIGLISSAIMGIIVVTKTFKFILDTIVHGLMLHSIFGWSFRLLAAIFDSITMYFVHRHHATRQETDVELVECVKNSMDCIQQETPKPELYPNLSDSENSRKPQWLGDN